MAIVLYTQQLLCVSRENHTYLVQSDRKERNKQVVRNEFSSSYFLQFFFGVGAVILSARALCRKRNVKSH